jgi:Pyrimidine dimer DNA glycosylase
MNIFATSECPEESAIVLPDRHINKMPIEACQLLSYVASPWFHNYGTLPKKDGTPYSTKKNPHLKHPCTLWTAASVDNAQWLIYHGFMLCEEFERRYNKKHACYDTLLAALELFPNGNFANHTPFVRAMPDELKFDKTIDTLIAYRKYLATKEWVADNYVRLPERKPSWI